MMTVKIKTSRGEETFLGNFREYRNQWSCLVIFKDDCFDHLFSLFASVSKQYDNLWSEMVVVYDNAFSVADVPATEGVPYTQSSPIDVLLGRVVKDVLKTLRDEQMSPEVRDGDTAFIYGQRHKKGYKVPLLEDSLFPRPQIPGEWELLAAIQKRD